MKWIIPGKMFDVCTKTVRENELFPKVHILLTLLATLPGDPDRVKTYLRNRTREERLANMAPVYTSQSQHTNQ